MRDDTLRHKMELSPTDPTLDAPPQKAKKLRWVISPEKLRGQAKPKAGYCQKLQMCGDSSSHGAGETIGLLQVRLRAAALTLFIGFGLFFFWGVYQGSWFTPLGEFRFGAHLAIDMVLGACYLMLRRRCPHAWNRLWIYEALIFGLPSLFFVLLQYESMQAAATRGYLTSPVGFWFAIIFTYALFIPNTWRRAAVILGMMSAAPLVLIYGIWMRDKCQCATLIDEQSGFLTETTLMMCIGFLTSTYGVYMIQALRREAYEARQLGQYRLVRQIGAGGMGEVYLAEHQMMKRPCALKVIRPGKANDPQALARFEREVQATAKLSHWNSVEIFDYGRTEDGTFYYVMEYLPGLNLAELVDRHGPLPAERVIHLISQTCDALGEAHAIGLIHRDLKPGNIFAARRGGIDDVAKLLDFGLAKPIVSAPDSVQLTQEGSITGSPLYMSPEQALGDGEPDARSDIYSMGAVIYYLLTGVPPFAGDKPLKVILAHAHEEILPPSRIRPEVPSDLDRVVMRCMAKRPSDRFQTAAELATALNECTSAGLWTRQRAADWWQSQESVEDADQTRIPVLV